MSDPWFRNIPLEFLFRSEEFLDDARLLEAVADEQFDSLIAQLEAAEGFLDGPALDRIIRLTIDGPAHDAVVNFMLNLARRDLGDPDAVIDAMESGVRDAIEADEADEADEIDVEKFRRRVDTLRGPFKALEQQNRAEGLSKSLGHRVVSHRFVTDLRPVFNEARDEVQGIFPVTTLRLVSAGATGRHECEVVLTEQDLNQLRSSADKASQKVGVLKRLLDDYGTPVPSIGMVQEGAEEEDGSGN